MQISQENIKIGDYVEYRYTRRKLGFVTGRRYSKILCKDLITCTEYPYEIDIYDLIPFRYVSASND